MSCSEKSHSFTSSATLLLHLSLTPFLSKHFSQTLTHPCLTTVTHGAVNFLTEKGDLRQIKEIGLLFRLDMTQYPQVQPEGKSLSNLRKSLTQETTNHKPKPPKQCL